MTRHEGMGFKFLNGALWGNRTFAVVGLANLPDILEYAVNFDTLLDILVRGYGGTGRRVGSLAVAC